MTLVTFKKLFSFLKLCVPIHHNCLTSGSVVKLDATLFVPSMSYSLLDLVASRVAASPPREPSFRSALLSLSTGGVRAVCTLAV